MDFSTLLHQLAQRLGLPSLQPDARDSCGLCFDEDLQVDLYHVADQGVLALAAEVGVPHEAARGPLLRWMLAANLNPAEQDDLYYALRPDKRAVTLCRSLQTEGLDADGLLGTLAQLVARTRACRQSFLHWSAL